NRDSSASVGELELYGSSGKQVARLSGDGTAAVGGGGVNGSFRILSAAGESAMYAGANDNQALIMLGNTGCSGHVLLHDRAGKITVVLDGAAGDISIGNADCAEEFDVEEEVMPGAVVVMGPAGRLVLAREPYDRRVVGIVSGLGRHRPG